MIIFIKDSYSILTQFFRSGTIRTSNASAFHHQLDYVLGTRALVRVLRVLLGHGTILGAPDIARRAHISLPTARDALRQLLAAELVSCTGAGRSVVCGMRHDHPLAPALAALFAAERSHAESILAAVTSAASGLAPLPLAVWLYGSVARGEDDPSSDIDIALVSPLSHAGAQADALRQALAAALPQQTHRVSVVAFSRRDIQRLVSEEAPLWKDIVRDAVVLAGSDPLAMMESLPSREPKA